MNELSENDFTLLHSLAPEQMPSIVHCPGSHEYFGHRPFAWKRLEALEVNLCVATDSLASTDTLSLLSELRRLARREPQLSGRQLLHTVTRNPARALGRGDVLGRISAGALADLIAVPTSGNVAQVHEEIVAFSRPIPWMMIDGQILRDESKAA
jgi:cytosine/adenosine deaminase-related metal-dependent hydrolase